MNLKLRNKLGNILWFILAILFGPMIEIVMVLRELWQYKQANEGLLEPLIDFEVDDLSRYTEKIILGSMIHIAIGIIITF